MKVHETYDRFVIKAYIELLSEFPHSDAALEWLWSEFDTPIDDNECIDVSFFIWPAGTNRYVIWEWIDGLHSKGLHHIVFGDQDYYDIAAEKLTDEDS